MSSNSAVSHLSFMSVSPLPVQPGRRLKLHHEIKEPHVCVTRRDEPYVDPIWVQTHSATGPNECAICLMWNRDGGGWGVEGDTSNVSNSGKTVTSLQRTAKINPQSHTRKPQERRKMGPVYKAARSAFSPAREAKVEKYVPLCSHDAACFPTCCVPLCACTCADSCDPVKFLAKSAFEWMYEPLFLFTCFVFTQPACVNGAESVFSIFHSPSLLLFSVKSPTVSLPTRPASLDLCHEEATLWLQWCVLKNKKKKSLLELSRPSGFMWTQILATRPQTWHAV